MSFFSRLQAAMFPGSIVEASEPAPPLPTLQVSAGQATYGQDRPEIRSHRLRWSYLPDADKKTAREIQKAADVLRPMYFCVDPEATDGIEEHYLARLMQLGSLEANVFERYAATLALTEWKA